MLLKRTQNDGKSVSKIVLCLDSSIDLGTVLKGISESREAAEINGLEFCLSV